ncbi:hypothetical protein [Thermococcus sp.]|uniref:hypothetical protein n=1 Tax=Thermococcus sp. TaxID=35749 RepID=UPI002624B68F|nr:hypothetical protein [Thermococcus sp.]
MEWERKLREEGFIEVGDFRIELTLDNTFLDLDYIPRVIVYDEETSCWHVLRNPIPKGKSLKEGWDNAVKVLEAIARGDADPVLGDDEVGERLQKALRELYKNGQTTP